jgi:hypothetical protein
MSNPTDPTFGGEVLRPAEPPALDSSSADRPSSFIDVVSRLNLQGPPDFSTRLDDYLYGELELPGALSDAEEETPLDR